MSDNRMPLLVPITRIPEERRDLHPSGATAFCTTCASVTTWASPSGAPHLTRCTTCGLVRAAGQELGGCRHCSNHAAASDGTCPVTCLHPHAPTAALDAYRDAARATPYATVRTAPTVSAPAPYTPPPATLDPDLLRALSAAHMSVDEYLRASARGDAIERGEPIARLEDRR